MKRLELTVHTALGVHAGPAHRVVKLAKQFADTAITITRGDKSARADGLLRLMALGVRTGDRVTITCDGPSEMAAAIAMQELFWNHL